MVALTIWIWGTVATGFVLFGAAFPTRNRTARWGLPVPCWASGGAVALVSIFAPSIVTGIDETIVTGSGPTIVPVAGLFAPIAVSVATGSRAWRPPGRRCRSGVFEPSPRCIP
jgi:hypothetical protein